MPNPTIIHPESSKIRHFLAIADFYIRLGKPKFYEVEPNIDESYRPDAYTRINGKPIVVEIQRTYCNNKRMQDKANAFVDTFMRHKHDARTLWIVSDIPYRVSVPTGFEVEQIPLTKEAG